MLAVVDGLTIRDRAKSSTGNIRRVWSVGADVGIARRTILDHAGGSRAVKVALTAPPVAWLDFSKTQLPGADNNLPSTGTTVTLIADLVVMIGTAAPIRRLALLQPWGLGFWPGMGSAALDCSASCSEILQSPSPSHDVWDGLLIAAMGTVGSSQAQAGGKSESGEMHSDGGSTSQLTRREDTCGNEWASPKVKARRK